MNEQDRENEYSDYLAELFRQARRANELNFIYTILRVGGMSFGHWDPMVEIIEALEDFNEILAESRLAENDKRQIRIGLLMYCHMTEMSAPYEIIANLLRCIKGDPYSPMPFGSGKKRKNALFGTPLYPEKKIDHLKQLAEGLGEDRLITIFDCIFDKEIRNAFSHSDYCLTADELHIAEIAPGRSIPMDKVIDLMNHAFAFYSAFFTSYNTFKLDYKSLDRKRRFRKLPNYELLELLVDDKEGLCGFQMHFSNGQKATFIRHKESVQADNIDFDSNGINFFVGDLDALAEKWLVNGEEYLE